MTPKKAIRIFYMMLGQAVTNEMINKPIAWALYQTWLKVDKQEKDRGKNRPLRDVIKKLEEAEYDYYIQVEYADAIKAAKEALIEQEASNAGNNYSN